VIVVLGCRPRWSTDGRLAGPLGRRVQASAERFARTGGRIVVAGGRTWGGVVEADAMHHELILAGVPVGCVIRERCSLTTRDNARLSRRVLGRLGARRVVLVTCEWHLARATLAFAREGLEVEGLPVHGPGALPTTRVYRALHEWAATRLLLGGVGA
jgi:uncharacterized SAM-binding protein YcdF (DUF218 family)